VPGVAIPDDAVAALAALGFAIADTGQVAGQEIGPFRGQETVGVLQAAGEGGTVGIDVHARRLL